MIRYGKCSKIQMLVIRTGIACQMIANRENPDQTWQRVKHLHHLKCKKNTYSNQYTKSPSYVKVL